MFVTPSRADPDILAPPVDLGGGLRRGRLEQKDEHTVRVVSASDEGGEHVGDDCQEGQNATGDEGLDLGSIQGEAVSVDTTLDDGDDEVMDTNHDCADSGR